MATGLLQRLEPMLVQALVAELVAEGLDVAVLHGLSRLDEQVPNVMLDRWIVQAMKARLVSSGPVVSPYRGRVAFLCKAISISGSDPSTLPPAPPEPHDQPAADACFLADIHPGPDT